MAFFLFCFAHFPSGYHCAVGIVYFIYKLWIGLVFWLTLLLMYPFFWVLLLRKEWYPLAFRLKCIWSRLFQILLLCPVRVVFKGTLPKPPYIIVSNHCSYLDTVFMYSVFSHYFLFIGKGELLKWPLFRLFFRKMDIPVERNNSKKAFNALQKAYEAIDRNECVAMYPEGTIPQSSPRMKAFKNGAFRMAVDKGVPIVPVTWHNNHRVILDPSKFFEYSLPQRVNVTVHEAVTPSENDDRGMIALRQHVFDTIASAQSIESKESPRTIL